MTDFKNYGKSDEYDIYVNGQNMEINLRIAYGMQMECTITQMKYRSSLKLITLISF